MLCALLLAGAACTSDGSDGSDASSTGAVGTTPVSAGDGATESGDDDGAAATPAVEADRCAANEAAGTITYISSFDFAAAATILDVVVADAEGYFDEVCLDVEIVPGFAPSNGALVAAGQGQISAAGSFGELVNTNVQGDAGLVAIAQYGHTGIEALVVPADGSIQSLSDLPGTTVGIKGDLPYSIQSMIGLAGVDRSSFQELLLDGFDPVAHLELGIDALPVYKSNEPAQLDAAGVDYIVFDPLAAEVPSSFGVLFTSEAFLAEHPTAVADFVRASLKGFEFAVADPDAALGHTFELIEAAGNPLFLFEPSERFRWTTESTLVIDTTPAGAPLGSLGPDEVLGAEISLLTEVGVFDEAPAWEAMIDRSVIDDVHDGEQLVWPGPAGLR